MGDRIAILREGSHVAQYDTPEHILSDPDGDFVEQFLGSGIVLKRLNLSRITDIDITTDDWPTIDSDTDTDGARARLRDTGRSHVLLIDGKRRPVRWIGVRDLDQDRTLDEAGTSVEATIDERATLNDALQEMLVSANGVAVVVDRHGAHIGTVDLETIMAAIREMRSEAHDRDAAAVSAGQEAM